MREPEETHEAAGDATIERLWDENDEKLELGLFAESANDGVMSASTNLLGSEW